MAWFCEALKSNLEEEATIIQLEIINWVGSKEYQKTDIEQMRK